MRVRRALFFLQANTCARARVIRGASEIQRCEEWRKFIRDCEWCDYLSQRQRNNRRTHERLAK